MAEPMARRHAPIPSLQVELVPVYRCGSVGRRHRSVAGAYRAAAWQAFSAAYPCECEAARPEDGDPGFSCENHAHNERVATLVSRLARWLRWRDGRRAAMAMEAGR